MVSTQIDPLALMESARLCGTWNQLRQFHEEERRRLRAAGVGKEVAKAESWRAAERQYPPALDGFFADFTRPPSLNRRLSFQVCWRFVTSLASIVSSFGFYSTEAVRVVRASRFRLSIDHSARRISDERTNQAAAERWGHDLSRFELEASRVFRSSLHSIHGELRLELAVKAELDALLAFLPPLVARANEVGLIG